MNVVVSGASGFLGTALVRALRSAGHDVRILVRGSDGWQPERRHLDPALLAGADAVVNLSGAGIGDHRWTPEYRRLVRASRIDSTSTLAHGIAAATERPAVFLSGSAIGAYGDTGDDPVDESAGYGAGFLPDLCREWEAATAPAAEAGVRTVHLRTGIVLSPAGGALRKVLPLFKLGLGGRLGSGRQWFSWIALPDLVAAVQFLLADSTLAGPVNLTAPLPVRNREYTAALGRAVHRPAALVVPAAALRIALGGFADEGVLASARVLPEALEAAGFDFTHPDLDGALAAVL
ncbi:MAG TPA: TIGR01777 family oxidoreductase [Mycobacteriales bacterium]|nr:TIGR01777 family oxidoreductase [Mycobacteriales bacterium]